MLLRALGKDIIILIYSKQIKLELLGCTNNCCQGLGKILDEIHWCKSNEGTQMDQLVLSIFDRTFGRTYHKLFFCEI
jgi:hypothetical protein